MVDDEEKTIDQLNDEADIAADYLEGLLDIIDYEGDIELSVHNGHPTVEIVADDDKDIKNLIGHHGEVVNALQLLSRLAVQERTGERSRLIVDVDGYLARRRKHLEDVALDAVDEVRESGDPVSLRYMNSFERKIVHDIVRAEGLKSRSHGVEPKRYVTVYLKASNDDEDLVDPDLVDENPANANEGLPDEGDDGFVKDEDFTDTFDSTEDLEDADSYDDEYDKELEAE